MQLHDIHHWQYHYYLDPDILLFFLLFSDAVETNCVSVMMIGRLAQHTLP
jgi:hypothetical protein